MPTEIDFQIPLTPQECRIMVTTGRFSHKEFTLENIVPNIPKTHIYYSKGIRHLSGNCNGVQFSRHGKIYKKSYEQSLVTIQINQMALKIEPSNIHQHSDDAILPYGFRVPAQHQNTTDPTIGTVVWDYKPPVCPKHGNPVQGFQTLYKGETNVKIKATATLENQFEGALFSATNKMLQNAKIPQNFALAIHANTSLCGQLAYSTNIENIMVIVLKHGQEGIKTNETVGLSQPHLISYKSQVTAQFIHSNHRIDNMAEKMYKAQCATEIKTIRNFLRIASATIFPSLKPHFSDGYTAIKGGAVIHVIKCKPIKVAIDTTRKGCFEEIPIIKDTNNKTPSNQTLWAHPVTKIILNRGTPATCSQHLPLLYKLTGGTYLCQDGTGLHRCKEPQLFIPNKNLPDFNATHNIHTILGTGILSTTSIKAFATRVYEPFYRETILSQMVIRNTGKPSFNSSTSLEPMGSDHFIDILANSVSIKVTPMYRTLGNAYFHIMAFFTVVAIFTTIFGIITRILWEVTHHGWTPRILLVTFNSVWQASRMPLDLLKNTVKGAHDNALKSNMVKVIDPLQLQVNQLKAAIIQYQTQQQHHHQGASETPPPIYQRLHEQPNGCKMVKEEANKQKSDPKNHDTPNFYPNLHHPMNRRRSLIIPPNNIRHRTPVITEVTGPIREEFEIDDDIQQIPPPEIRSTSSILRNNLTHLAQAASRIYNLENQPSTTHQGQLRLRQLPTAQHQPRMVQPPHQSTRTWHTTWHPPMPFPPSAPPLTSTWRKPGQANLKASVTRYPRGSRADHPTTHNGFTITRQTFTTPCEWKQHQTIFLPSDEEDETPAKDPLAMDNDQDQLRLKTTRRKRSDDSKP